MQDGHSKHISNSKVSGLVGKIPNETTHLKKKNYKFHGVIVITCKH